MGAVSRWKGAGSGFKAGKKGLGGGETKRSNRMCRI